MINTILYEENHTMNNQQRHKASVQQTIYYLNTYYSDWRLTKLLSLEKMLNERYTFFNDIKHNVKQHDDENGDATIAQEIKNGIYFDAIATCIQYVEDLFALLNASQKPDYFIKEILTYNPSDISKFIDKLIITKERLGELFHYPTEFGNNTTKETITEINKSTKILEQLILDSLDFYKKHKFKYNKYKHGLSVALRPLGKKIIAENVEKDKNNNHKPYLLAFDSYNLEKAKKRGGFSGKLVMIPFLTDEIRPFAQDLEKEDNLLRSVPIEEINDMDFFQFTELGYKVSTCLKIFIHNYTYHIDYRTKQKKFQLPQGHKTREVLQGEYTID
ncbi:MAG: hypothetical protein R2800_05245 [Flavipsychrobacter sp.]